MYSFAGFHMNYRHQQHKMIYSALLLLWIHSCGGSNMPPVDPLFLHFNEEHIAPLPPETKTTVVEAETNYWNATQDYDKAKQEYDHIGEAIHIAKSERKLAKRAFRAANQHRAKTEQSSKKRTSTPPNANNVQQNYATAPHK